MGPRSLIPGLFLACFLSSSLVGQTELVRNDYFPAEFEFVELHTVRSEESLDKPSSLVQLADGDLIAEVGFHKYQRRSYNAMPSGNLTIETVTLKDAKAAYSLLTLFGKSKIVPGPPGDAVATDGNNLVFAQANVLVRIQSDVPGDLAARVARSVSNRIGRHGRAPLLVSHFPKIGYDPGSLRYYLGPMSVAKYAYNVAGRQLSIQEEVEIAQARYILENQTGVLSVVGFPTSQLADEYFDRLFAHLQPDARSGHQLYFKRAGPILGILDGPFDPGAANQILSSVEFTYSISWIFDKRHSNLGTIWGVPVGMLGTVVRSLVLTGVLCGLSLIAGVLIGVFRFLLRGYAPNNFLDRPDRIGMIRLKLNEK